MVYCLRNWLKILIIFMGIFSIVPVQAVTPYKWPYQTWINLSVGIYWLKEVNGKQIYCKANPGKKPILACKKPPFNPKQPTMIFVHGWEPLSTEYRERDEYIYRNDWTQNTKAQLWDLAKPWLKKHWNVGVFYWNQLADEDDVVDAEAKIWKTHGPTGMRWRHYTGVLIDKNTGKVTYFGLEYNKTCKLDGEPCPSVGNILYNDYVKALKGYQGNDIRIVGHSLGGQLSIYLLHLISLGITDGQVSPALMPRRLSLLDPFYSPYSYIKGKNPRQIAANYVKQLVNENGVIIDEYLSSDLTLQDIDGPIAHYAAVTEYNPDFCDYYDQMCEHSAAWLIYYLSYADKPPAEYIKYIDKKTGLPKYIKMNQAAGSASTPDSRIAQMMGGEYYWSQYLGDDTVNPKDDAFVRVHRSKEFGIYVTAKKVTIKVANKSQDAVASISGNKISINISALSKGRIVKLNATVMPTNASNKLVLWKSSDPKVAVVYPGGYVKALAPGFVKITATAPNDGQQPAVSQTVTLIFI